MTALVNVAGLRITVDGGEREVVHGVDVEIPSGGTVGFRRPSAGRSQDSNTISAVVSRPSVPVDPITSSDADTVCQPIVAKSWMAGCSTS